MPAPQEPDSAAEVRLAPSGAAAARRLAVALAASALAACVTPARSEVPLSRAAIQWRSVTAQSPLIAEAFIKSLIALAENEPFAAAQARADAFDVAQQCGLVTGLHPSCEPCRAPQPEQERDAYVSCLARRLYCLEAH